MVTSLASQNQSREIYELMIACRDAMIKDGINQWDESYPSLSHIEKDIEQNRLHVLTEDSSLIGAIVMDTSQSPQYKNINWNYNLNPILVVHRLAVHPLVQNKGLGKKLMLFAEKYAHDNDYRSIRLDAYKHNDSLQNFYHNLDYKEVGEIDLEYTEGPFVCFEKKM
jgi:ribosomal protein S18 acetylase RimI-like enzyme